MQLEELILLDFLKALQNESNEEIIATLKAYISVNQKRRELLSPISQEWEARQADGRRFSRLCRCEKLRCF